MSIENTLPVQGTQISQGPKDKVQPKDKVLLDADYDLDVQILETSKKPNTRAYTDGDCSGGYTCGNCSGDHTCGNCQ